MQNGFGSSSAGEGSDLQRSDFFLAFEIKIC